ncbi:Sex-determining transformer protein 2 [Caenorhabditis elegans]|uniref:Isoform b of Sex-determining transformer protein 2 n=1 Tax=Caenorhabditis elegans TaxID=6239 RepID=P34709-2|nr:Sex-determining transformer protein 2 [Caenorhabditis elegans]CCD64612.1 Sex-determining transformer protein 2 [Caenorhabditis elegans]|eukprot:NP_001021954.1 Sex-determining transformer protein 2 [Caenorhabditis elegans]
MKLKYNKLLVSVVIVTFVTFGLLLAECFGKSIDYQEKSIFPSFVSQGFFETRTNNEEYIIEKIAQTQENGVDMRSTLHFTQHGYLLNNISNLKIKFRQKTYTLNDVCFKPHITIFQQSSSSDQNEYPHYIQRLLLEMQRLSPCLIVTPLNCFYDIYRIHGEISNWNKNTDFLNRRLRNSYIEAIGENDERPYVKSNYGPSLIKSWADHMFDLPSKSFTNSTKDALFQKIKLWLLSIEPRQKTCAASIHSCDTPLDSEHYFNICTDMQSVDNFAEKKTKFKLEDVDEEFAMNLDCVDDQEQFIEWMQELEIRKMYSHVTEKPDYPNVVNQTCDKIFHDLNSTGIEFFDGSRSFSSTKSQFDTMQTEIVLLTPEMLLSAMQHSDFVNGFESIWTIEKAEELIHEFRLALKEETEKFKENRMSKMIRVTSRVLDNTVTTKLQSFSEKQTIHFVVNVHSLIVILFTIFVWSGAPLRSAFMFFVRDALTCLLFCFVCSTDGVIVLDTELIKYIIVLTLANLYFTTRSSFCTERLSRCIQREKRFPINSNFASLITVDTMTDSRQIQYFLSTVTKYQAAQDSYSNELFERFPKNWGCTSILIFPIVFVYWYFIDSNFDKICVSVLPSFCLAAGEELFAKNMFWKEREAMQAKQRLENEEQAESITGSSLEKLFAGNKPVSNTDKANIVKKSSIIRNQKPCLQDLSPGTYDVSNFMKYPHQASRIFREKIIGLYLRILKLRTLGVILCIPAILLIVISIGLLFIPVKRETLHTDSKQDDIFIEFEIFNFSTNWKIVNQNLKQFSEDIESIGTLYTISNWQKSFERFEQETNKNASAEWNILFKWINDEPINSAVTLFSEKSSGNQTIANPFKFRLRYGFDAKNETTVIEIVQKIDELLSKCSKNLSPKAVGVLYEHYHRIAVVWNLFAFNQLTTAGIFIILLSIITFIFAITPTIKATFLFSLLVVGTQIEVAALVHLFSLDHHQIYTNLALFAGFLAAWDPFCALLRYRRRILYKSETRRTPELASKRRVLLPIVATADIAQFFVLLITEFPKREVTCQNWWPFSSSRSSICSFFFHSHPSSIILATLSIFRQYIYLFSLFSFSHSSSDVSNKKSRGYCRCMSCFSIFFQRVWPQEHWNTANNEKGTQKESGC